MAKFFRSRSRFRRRSFSRFRRSRFIRKMPRPGTRRFFKRQRRNAPPEVKFFYKVQTTVGGNLIAHDAKSTDILTPEQIAAGTEASNRVGRQVKFRKVILRNFIFTYDDPNVPNDNIGGKVRVVIWYPTRDYTSASTYMTALPYLEEPDWNTVRVLRDHYIDISNANYVFTAANENFNPSPPTPTSSVKKYILPFPRTVEFVDAAGNTDPNKDRLYMTVWNPTNYALNWSFSSKTTFIDP